MKISGSVNFNYCLCALSLYYICTYNKCPIRDLRVRCWKSRILVLRWYIYAGWGSKVPRRLFTFTETSVRSLCPFTETTETYRIYIDEYSFYAWAWAACGSSGECGAVFFLAQELEFIKISYEQVCTSFETVDSPAVDVLAELLSRQGDIRSSRAHVSG